MFELDAATYRACWSLIALVGAALWVAFGLLANGNRVFLAVALIYSIVAFAGFRALFRTRPRNGRP